jgi:peptide/nickel transport system permease protein
MQKYIVQRLLLAIPTIILVSLIAASLIRLVPGDVVLAKVAESGNTQNIDVLRAELGLDVPFPQQYVEFMWGLVTLNPGDSLYTTQPVAGEFWDAFPVTLELGFLAIVLSVVIAIPLGAVSAMRPDSWVDHGARMFAVFGLAVPDFWIATVLVVYLSLYLGYLPPLGYAEFYEDPLRNLSQVYLPVLILGYRLAGISIRMMRSTMLDVLGQDYIRTARSKGLAERVVVIRHALKNAMIPVLTIVGTQVGFIIGGSVILETIFGLPGVGRLTFSAIQQRDYTQVQFNVVMLGTFLVLTNLAVDLVYGWLDPRIRYG